MLKTATRNIRFPWENSVPRTPDILATTKRKRMKVLAIILLVFCKSFLNSLGFSGWSKPRGAKGVLQSAMQLSPPIRFCSLSEHWQWYSDASNRFQNISNSKETIILTCLILIHENNDKNQQESTANTFPLRRNDSDSRHSFMRLCTTWGLT